MISELVIKPRQCGKTTAYIKAADATENSVYITHSTFTKDLLKRKVKNTKVIPQSINIEREILGSKHIFVDEYFLMSDHTKELLFELAFNETLSIYAFGTPVKQYDEYTVNLCKEWWRIKQICKYPNVLLPFEVMCRLYSKELMHNLLVHPNVDTHYHYEYRKVVLSPEEYETQILGKIFK